MKYLEININVFYGTSAVAEISKIDWISLQDGSKNETAETEKNSESQPHGQHLVESQPVTETPVSEPTNTEVTPA